MTLRFQCKMHRYPDTAANSVLELETYDGASVIRFTGGGGSAYVFRTFSRTWLHGKKLKFRWFIYVNPGYQGYGKAYILDGEYRRYHDQQFKAGQAITSKGNGQLQLLAEHYPTTGQWWIEEVIVDVSNGVRPNVSVFFEGRGNHIITSIRLDYFQIIDPSTQQILYEEEFASGLVLERQHDSPLPQSNYRAFQQAYARVSSDPASPPPIASDDDFVPIVKWQLREHDRYGACWQIEFTNIPRGWTTESYPQERDGGAIEINCGSPADITGCGYIFTVLPRAWLHGKTVVFRWRIYASGTIYIRSQVYDGSYDRTNDSDFPTGSAMPTKGAGLLQTLDSHGGGNFAEHEHEVVADVDEGTEANCTLFFWIDDPGMGYAYASLAYVAIKDPDGKLKAETFFEDSIIWEKTASCGDYGTSDKGNWFVTGGTPRTIGELIGKFPWSETGPTGKSISNTFSALCECSAVLAEHSILGDEGFPQKIGENRERLKLYMAFYGADGEYWLNILREDRRVGAKVFLPLEAHGFEWFPGYYMIQDVEDMNVLSGHPNPMEAQETLAVITLKKAS